VQFCSSDGWCLFDVSGPNSTTPCRASSAKLWSQAKVPSRSLTVCKTQPAAIGSRSKCRSISSAASGKRPSSEEVSICQAPLHCSRVEKRTRGGRNPSQSTTASGEQLLACVLHPALYGTGGNAERQGQGQETTRGSGFAEILA